MIKKVTIILTMVIIIICMCSSISLGADADPIEAMKGMAGEDLTDSTGGKLGDLINTAISIIQVAGTGISIIMVTMLGIKYLLAAPSDKADVKKQILPLLIGAIILFASVNLVGIISKVADTTLSQAASGS